MSTPLIVTHPCTLLHEGLRQTFKKSSLRPVRVLSVLDEEAENYIRSLQSCVWLVGVEKNSSVTNELVRRVVTTSPGVKAVILATYQRPNDILAALQAGARGFLCQDIPGERLIKSLELIAHDKMVVHPQLATEEWKDDAAPETRSGELQQLLHSDSQSSASRLGAAMEPNNQSGCVTQGLTRREMLILRSLMDGASNKAIALKLVMTESTVKVHMKSILRKLRLQNRTQAAIWAGDHADKLTLDRGPLERTGSGLTTEASLRTTTNVASWRAPAEL